MHCNRAKHVHVHVHHNACGAMPMYVTVCELLLDELDSFMFQTVGHEGIAAYAEAMRIPLYRRVTKGLAIKRELVYSPEDGDEVEDLYQLLKTVKVCTACI